MVLQILRDGKKRRIDSEYIDIFGNRRVTTTEPDGQTNVREVGPSGLWDDGPFDTDPEDMLYEFINDDLQSSVSQNLPTDRPCRRLSDAERSIRRRIDDIRERQANLMENQQRRKIEQQHRFVIRRNGAWPKKAEDGTIFPFCIYYEIFDHYESVDAPFPLSIFWGAHAIGAFSKVHTKCYRDLPDAKEDFQWKRVASVDDL